MFDVDPSDFEIQTCGECGATNDPSYTYCRKCGTDLSKSSEFMIPMWLAAGAIILFFLFIMMIATSMFFEDVSVIFSGILIFIGFIMGVVGSIWFYIEAFRENVLWGLACLFIPFASFVFLLLHPGRAIKPLALSILGAIILISTSFFIPTSLPLG